MAKKSKAMGVPIRPHRKAQMRPYGGTSVKVKECRQGTKAMGEVATPAPRKKRAQWVLWCRFIGPDPGWCSRDRTWWRRGYYLTRRAAETALAATRKTEYGRRKDSEYEYKILHEKDGKP